MVKLRTECFVEPQEPIAYTDKLLFIGSCFSDEIGGRVAQRGFDTVVNPFGPLYNPVSIAKCLLRMLEGPCYSSDDLVEGPRGYHCLDYATRFSGSDAGQLIAVLNAQREAVAGIITSGATVFITLGTAYVYRFLKSGRIVGNCHKFPAKEFERFRLSVARTTEELGNIVGLLRRYGAKRVIFTISPIRHLADGFHANTVSKATLHLAVEDTVAANAGFSSYFPAFEIVNDDLRDYRAYASDLVHVSDIAADYIFEKFADTYFEADTRMRAAEELRRYRSSQHRTILQ